LVVEVLLVVAVEDVSLPKNAFLAAVLGDTSREPLLLLLLLLCLPLLIVAGAVVAAAF